MLSLYDFFSPQVIVVSEKQYEEMKEEKRKRKLKVLTEELSYYQKLVSNVEEKIKSLETDES